MPTRKQNEVVAKIISPETVNMNAQRRQYNDASIRRLIGALDNAHESGFSTKRFMEQTGIARSQFQQWRVRLGIEVPDREARSKALISERTQAAIKGIRYRINQLPTNRGGRRTYGVELRRDMVALYLTAKSENPDYRQSKYSEEIGVLSTQLYKWMLDVAEPSNGAHEPEQLTIPDPHFEAMNGNGAEVVLSNFPTQALAVRKPTARRRIAVTCVIKIECPNVLAAVEQLQNLPLEGRVEISILPDVER